MPLPPPPSRLAMQEEEKAESQEQEKVLSLLRHQVANSHGESFNYKGEESFL